MVNGNTNIITTSAWHRSSGDLGLGAWRQHQCFSNTGFGARLHQIQWDVEWSNYWHLPYFTKYTVYDVEFWSRTQAVDWEFRCLAGSLGYMWWYLVIYLQSYDIIQYVLFDLHECPEWRASLHLQTNCHHFLPETPHPTAWNVRTLWGPPVTTCLLVYTPHQLPIVPHKAVAEVSKLGNL